MILGAFFFISFLSLMQVSSARTLLSAAARGDVSEIENFVTNGVNPNNKGEDGTTPLMLAAFGGHIPAAQYLIEAGAKVNDKDKMGNTALMQSAFGANLNMAKFLVEEQPRTDVTF